MEAAFAASNITTEVVEPPLDLLGVLLHIPFRYHLLSSKGLGDLFLGDVGMTGMLPWVATTWPFTVLTCGNYCLSLKSSTGRALLPPFSTATSMNSGLPSLNWDVIT